MASVEGKMGTDQADQADEAEKKRMQQPPSREDTDEEGRRKAA